MPFVQLASLQHLHRTEQFLLFVSLPIRLDRQRFPHSPTKHYHATFPAPTGQLQFARQPLPAPSGRLPIVASEQSRNMPFHLRRLPDLEQVRQRPFLALHHHGFRAPVDISPSVPAIAHAAVDPATPVSRTPPSWLPCPSRYL